MTGAVLAAAATVAGGWWVRTYQVQPAGPTCDCPSAIDLGVRQPNEEFEATFEIRNVGRSELVVSDFQTSCRCTPVRAAADPLGVELGRRAIPPGGRFAVVVGIRGGSDPGAGRAVVRFRTNEPAGVDREVTITFRTQGRLRADPPELYLGDLAPGKAVVRTVRLWDRERVPPGQVERVESSRPDVVRVTRYHPPGDGPSLGEVEVAISAPTAPGSIREELTVYEPGRPTPSLRIPVIGRTIPEVEVLPSAVLLPRAVGGRWVDEANLIVRSTRGRPLRLTVRAVAPLTAEATGSGGGPTPVHSVRVRFAPADGHRPDRVRTFIARLIASWDDGSAAIDVPVTVRPPE